MKLPSLRYPPRRQSFWRAVAAAAAAYLLMLVALASVYWVLRPFVWAALYGEPYSPPPGSGPYPLDSGQWLFTQAIGFCASIAAGVMGAYWSPPRSSRPIVVLVLLSFGGLLFGEFPLETSPLRMAMYALQMPLGLTLGAFLLRHLQVRTQKNGSGGAPSYPDG
jgi:hypothetical protein